MPKIPEVSPKKIAKILTKLGFIPRLGKGSHVVFRHPDGRRTVLSVHNKAITIGTLHGILKQVELSLPDFLELLKSS